MGRAGIAAAALARLPSSSVPILRMHPRPLQSSTKRASRAITANGPEVDIASVWSPRSRSPRHVAERRKQGGEARRGCSHVLRPSFTRHHAPDAPETAEPAAPSSRRDLAAHRGRRRGGSLARKVVAEMKSGKRRLATRASASCRSTRSDACSRRTQEFEVASRSRASPRPRHHRRAAVDASHRWRSAALCPPGVLPVDAGCLSLELQDFTSLIMQLGKTL